MSYTPKSVDADVNDAPKYGIHKALNGNLEDDPEEGIDALYITSDSRRTIGLTSAIFLIFNRMIGTGIFATPSTIFALCGSVGLTLFIWIAGMLIAFAGMYVYLVRRPTDTLCNTANSAEGVRYRIVSFFPLSLPPFFFSSYF